MDLQAHIESLQAQALTDSISFFVVGLAVINDKQEILIMKRSYDDDFLAGYYEIPGGGVDEGETVINAIHRELKEETNLEASIIHPPYGSFDYVCSQNLTKRQWSFVVEVKETSNLRLNPEEHIESLWLPIASVQEWIQDLHCSEKMKECILAGCNRYLQM